MKILQNKTLKELTTFKIGGQAKYFCAPQNFDEMKEALLFAKKNNLKTFILGRGSNILFDDEGFFGLVIKNDINFLRILKTNIYVGAGYSFASLGIQTAYNDLSGLEYAAGVPGSVGGAIFMNASAYNQAVSDSISRVTYLDEDCKIASLKKDQMEFDYRTSIFQKRNVVILSCSFELNQDVYAKEKQMEILKKKRQTQPTNEKNAGCIFKNPNGFSAGKLIEECKLKNYQIGGAKVSDIHANFIINEKEASSKDVLNLILYIKKEVKNKKNIILQEEIKIISP
jgi:UDP-N-acetylmuramate dehydrogenase